MTSARRTLHRGAAALLALGFGFLPLDRVGAELSSAYIKDPKTGCQLWNPEPFEVSDPRVRATGVPGALGSGSWPTPTTFSWTGACKDGFAEGKGVVRWFDRNDPIGYTEGEFRKGMLFGRAVTVYTDGRRAEGEYDAGKLNGRAILTFPNGNRFDGQFRDNRPNGKGKSVDAEGNRYEGEFQLGRRDGNGTLLNADGSRYDGHWSDGMRDGHGVYIWADGRRYDGDWDHDRPDGEGTYWNLAGQQFSGVWEDGCLETDDAYVAVFRSMDSCGFE
ncbi:MAG TPA: hypothetical protein VMG55_22050 [Stellaceae bacterium]|nr:hypothetical protein [Stellaceae bacterium]